MAKYRQKTLGMRSDEQRAVEVKKGRWCRKDCDYRLFYSSARLQHVRHLFCSGMPLRVVRHIGYRRRRRGRFYFATHHLSTAAGRTDGLIGPRMARHGLLGCRTRRTERSPTAAMDYA